MNQAGLTLLFIRGFHVMRCKRLTGADFEVLFQGAMAAPIHLDSRAFCT
jgi:hypothetical protein